MVSMRNIIMVCIGIVIAVVLTPTVWDAVWVDSASTSGTSLGINGTTWTLLKLVPLIYVGAVVIGGVVLAFRSK